MSNPNTLEKLRKSFASALTALFPIVVFLSIFGYSMGDSHYFIDMISHFLLQNQIILAMYILLLSLLAGKQRNLWALLVPVLVVLFFVQPLSLIPDKVSSPIIYYQNTNYFKGNPEEVLRQVRDTNPTTVAIVEFQDELTPGLEELYPNNFFHHSEGALSCAIFTKETPIQIGALALEYPVCFAKFEKYTLYVIHPYPPLSQDLWEKQQALFKQVEGRIQQDIKQERDFVVVGDFNSTPYSPVFREYFAPYHQKNLYTWSDYPFLSIPIDHALSNMPLTIGTLSQGGSDHAPLIVEFQVNPSH